MGQERDSKKDVVHFGGRFGGRHRATPSGQQSTITPTAHELNKSFDADQYLLKLSTARRRGMPSTRAPDPPRPRR